MLIIDKESTIFIDVDDTLVMWGVDGVVGKDLIDVKCPHDGSSTYLAPHMAHIKVLKDRKARGSYIVVWSAGGFEWANAVVVALGLTKYVDLVMTKPHAHIDDKQPVDIMGEHIYIPFNPTKNGYGEQHG